VSHSHHATGDVSRAGETPPRRSGRLLYRVIEETAKAIEAFAVWVAMFLLAAALTVNLAAALPGVVPFERSNGLLLVQGILIAAVAAGVLFMSSGLRAKAPTLGRAVARLSELSANLGLHRPRLRWYGLLAAGGLTAVAAVITGEVLVRVPALAETAAGTDARIDALADAPRWAGSLYLAIYSPLPEELIYRGLLLLVVGGYLARFRSASVRRVTVVLALVAMSTIFGMHHLGWSLLNAVSAGVHGLMYGAIALWTRSLWPAVLAHTLHNLWVGMGVMGVVTWP